METKLCLIWTSKKIFKHEHVPFLMENEFFGYNEK